MKGAMASTKEYHYMEPPSTSPHSQSCFPGKINTNLSPMDLDFTSAMNLNNSSNITPPERQCTHSLQQKQQPQQQQQQRLPAISQVSRSSSFRLPSFASLISGKPSQPAPQKDRLGSSSTTSHSYSNEEHSPLHLPTFEHLSNRSPMMLTQSSSEYSGQQPVYEPLHSSSASCCISMTCDNNRASFVIPPTAPTSDSTIDTSPTPTPAKKGRRARKHKFISRVLDANMQWPTCKNKNNDVASFRPYQYEHRQSSQQQQQHQQEGRRRRISSVGTASSLTSSTHVSSSATTVGSSPSSSTATSVISTLSATMVKPRWQETERLDLLKAIVKEKQLDDMTSFSWDKISMAVGRAKKACKDQYRREILPALMDRLK